MSNLPTVHRTNVLEAVEVDPLQTTDRDKFFLQIGRQEALNTLATMTNLMWAENLRQMKETGAYKKLGLTWEKAIEKTGAPFSYKTADRMISNLEEFGRGFFQVRDVARITSEAYRAIAPTVEEGFVIISGERVALTKQNASQIQALFQAEQQKLQELRDKQSHTEEELKKTRKDRDGAKKAVERTREELEQLKRPRYVPDDPDHEQILRVAEERSMLLGKLRNLKVRDLSPDNRGRLLGLANLIASELIEVVYQIREAFGTGYNAGVEEEDMRFAEEFREESRDVMAEFEAQKKAKK